MMVNDDIRSMKKIRMILLQFHVIKLGQKNEEKDDFTRIINRLS